MWRDYRAEPTIELRNYLVERYLSLVKYNAERIWARLPDGVDLDDLISAGVFGLMDAIDAFDLERGVKFETYCVPRIRGAMLDELRKRDWTPRTVRARARRMEQARAALAHRLGRAPDEIELARPAIAQQHRMNAGVIVEQPLMDVRFKGGRRLGTVEEGFASTLSPGDHFFFSFFAELSSTFSSFCSTTGLITMLFTPTRRICSRISLCAPLPTASMAITAATPKIIPRAVSNDRTLFAITASTAINKLATTLGGTIITLL